MKELVFHHKQGVADGIHIPYSFEYDTAAQRVAATGFVVGDLTKLALQKDNNTFWLLTGISPTVWQPISFPESIYNILLNNKTLIAGDNITFVPQGDSGLVINSSGGGEVGVTAHGELTGLNLDHHVQYLNVTRHQTPGLHELTRVVGGTLIGTVPHDDLGGLTNVTINNETLEPDDVLMFRSGVWQNLPLPVVSHTQNGVMTTADKIILDGLAGSSDIRLKKNIEPIVNALDTVRRLNGVYFNWDTSIARVSGFGDVREIGLVAQDVEGVMPEVVATDESGYKRINYGKLCALLIEAIKEQQQQIAMLKCEVAALR